MPKSRPFTLELLKVTENTHFYDPCAKCRPDYEALMREKRLCTMCPGGIPEEGRLICSECICSKKEGCECRVCKMRREAAAGPQIKTVSISHTHGEGAGEEPLKNALKRRREEGHEDHARREDADEDGAP